jgi:undecaprenyldiphospho-muramoylpentapeptide beta-N-acetylglucosaminyltransferase
MRVVVSAGGTGGHIYPALAIINKIKENEPNSEFLYIGTHNRMEKDIVPKENIPFKSVEIYGFNKRNIFKNFKTIKCLFSSYKTAKSYIKNFNPDVVIGVGGYVTVPVILAAHKLGVKTFLHEQNSLPGKSNMYLSKYVSKIGVSFKSSINSFPSYKTVFTGNPCSEDALKKGKVDKKFLGFNPKKKLVLITMGSLGSATFNKYLLSIKEKFSAKDYDVMFITGNSDFENINKNEFPKNVKILPYFDNLTKLMAVTDVMISRAGASTMSELIALEVPTILIPSPFVANNHQYKNALDLTRKNAAYLLEEKNLKNDILLDKIDYILEEKKTQEYKENLKKMKFPKSATKIYKELKELIDGK